MRVHKYLFMVERVARRESKVIEVRADDIEEWVRGEEDSGSLALLDPELRQEARELPAKIEGNTLRYVGLMETVLDAMVEEAKERMNRSNARRQQEAVGTQMTEGEGEGEMEREGEQGQEGGEGREGGREVRRIVQATLKRS